MKTNKKISLTCIFIVITGAIFSSQCLAFENAIQFQNNLNLAKKARDVQKETMSQTENLELTIFKRFKIFKIKKT